MGLWHVQECRRTWAHQGDDLSYDAITHLTSEAKPFLAVIDPDDNRFLHPGDMPERIRKYCADTKQPVPETRGEIIRVALESLALKTRKTLEDLELVTGRRLNTIRIVGGGSQNRLQCQFTADACNRPVIAGPVEATALGNIMLQAIATGRLADLRQGRQALASSVDRRRYEPHPNPACNAAYQRFLSLLS